MFNKAGSKDWLIHLTAIVALALPSAGMAATVRFDFETGDLQGWKIEEGGLAAPVCSRETYHNTALGPTYNKQGKYFVSTLESAAGTMDIAQTAVIESPVFILEGPALSFLIGGGAENNTYVALCTEDGQEVFKASGNYNEVMQRITWDAPALVGKKVFLTIVDKETAGWAHVTFDDFTAQGTLDPQASEALHATYAERQNRKVERAKALVAEREAKRTRRLAERMADERLYSRGERRVYEGVCLGAISLPLGGIAAGPIQINGEGRRHSWQIFKNYQGLALPDSFFAVRARAGAATPVTRVLQTVAEGVFQPMKALRFSGEYPFGWFTFEDPELPVAVSMEVFSPLIPLNERDSAIPCAIFNLTARNNSQQRVEVTFLAAQQNALGLQHGSEIISNRSCSAYGKNRNKILKDGGATMLHLTADQPQDSPARGDLALATLATGAAGTAEWTSNVALCEQFTADGAVSGAEAAGPSPAGQTLNGALVAPLTLAPGEARTVSFVLAWHFPNVEPVKGHRGNRYAAWWPDALAVARDVTLRLEELTRQTRLYNETLYESNLPWWLLDRISSQVAILSANTCSWDAKGFFWGWEGCNPASGCCAATPTHVWGYAQAHARLFPAIARTMREHDLANMRPDGMLPVRFWANYPAFDGQCHFVLSAYREHLVSANDRWLRTHWQKVKQAMDYLIARWDAAGTPSAVEERAGGIPDGMIGGPQHGMDGDQSGTSSWMGGLYLGALAAAEKMAGVMGDTASETYYRAIRERGSLNQDKALFNGEYFIQVPDNPPLQDYLTGCYIDQLLGQWSALQVGCGWLYPAEHVRSAMSSLFRYNFRADFQGIQQVPRKFVEDDEAGMVQCTWPKGGRPGSHLQNEIGFADEVMSGFEYAAAGLMVSCALTNEAFTVLRAAADRYDGRLRTGLTGEVDPNSNSWGYSGNPFGDDECGKFYARAMSIWSVLLACQGFTYDGPAGQIGFKPVWKPEDHRSFFSAAEGWGLFTQTRTLAAQTERIEVRYGKLALKTMVFSVASEMTPAEVIVKVGDNILPSGFEIEEGSVRITLASVVTIGQERPVDVIINRERGP
jgi:uncharacterized protein (DUF608 family)